MMLTVHEIKTLEEIPSCPSTKLTVLSVSELESANDRKRFYAVLADTTGAISATIYNEKDHGKFIEGFGVTLMNVLCKQSYIGVTIKTEVAMCQAIEVSEEVKQNAPKLPGSTVNSIEDALGSPDKTVLTVKGKVTKVSSPLKKLVNKKDMDFQDIVIKDKTGSVEVALWDRLVGTIEKGQTIEIRKCRVKLFREEKKLNTTFNKTTEVFVTEDELFEVSSDEEVNAVDEAAHVSMAVGTVEAVSEVDPYLSCPIASCNNVKMVTVKGEDDIYRMKCKVCHGTFQASSCNKYMRAVMLLKTDSELKKVVMFSPQIQKMFVSRGLDCTILFEKIEMMKKLLTILPVEIKYRMINNTVRELICKRVY